MALPLLAAAAVEGARLDLSRWRRHLVAACLPAIAACWLANVGWGTAAVLLAFALCGVRLSLPRGKAAGRQALLLAFLLFLVAAITSTSISFLPFALLWAAAAGHAMIFHYWRGARPMRQVRRGARPMRQVRRDARPMRQVRRDAHPMGQRGGPPGPMRRALLWTAAAVPLACLVFWAMPRPAPGWRPPVFGANGFGGAEPGLSDALSLEGGGAIRRSGSVVARVLPPQGLSPAERRRIESRIALLMAFRMELARQGRWERGEHDPKRGDVECLTGKAEKMDAALSYFAYPTPAGLIPLPQGPIRVAPPPNMRMEALGGGALRWERPAPPPVRFALGLGPGLAPGLVPGLGPAALEPAPDWQIERRGLTPADPATSAALDWSLRVAPPTEGGRPSGLAEILANELRTFGYTLDNPSGGAKDPLGDFLTRTRAGHCEYFAHALASALRHRGVASRVVVGYRLGRWIEGGGYWLVTQNEAHSWVEYLSPEKGGWVPIDPTPAAPGWPLDRGGPSQRLGDAIDAMRFRWDRYVLRFSGAEQRAGLSWARAQAAGLGEMGPRQIGICAAIAASIAASAVSLYALWAKRGSLKRRFRPSRAPAALAALRPLIGASGIQPLCGETLRSWLGRLAKARPERRPSLAQLADLAERRAYGAAQGAAQGGGEDVASRAADEAKAWKKAWKKGAG
jgi:hypothetical protein